VNPEGKLYLTLTENTPPPFLSRVAEQHPEEWLKAVALTVDRAIAKGAVKKKHILAVALSGATHGFVLTDQKGKPLRLA